MSFVGACLIGTLAPMAGKENELGQTGKTVAENIKRLRGSTSYAELSRWMQDVGRPIPPLGLRRIEAGERRVDADDLMAFAFVFGVNTNALLLPPDDGAAEYRPTGAKHSRPLRRVWDWADGLKPFLLDSPEAQLSFSLHARPPGRDAADFLLTAAQAATDVQEQLGELQRTVDELLSERRKRLDGDD